MLRTIIERVGPCRMEYGPPEFHSLAEAIVYQQLNGKAAVTIFKRFAALAGEPLTPEGILKLRARPADIGQTGEEPWHVHHVGAALGQASSRSPPW